MKINEIIGYGPAIGIMADLIKIIKGGNGK